MCKRLTTEEFITKAKEIHGDKYDYSKVEYKKATVVPITTRVSILAVRCFMAGIVAL